jgi:hypothetical protein
MDPFELGVRRRVAGDHYSDEIDAKAAGRGKVPKEDKLDSAPMRAVHRKLLDWFFHERTKQAENRMQMALDADYYDGLQWSPEDAETVSARGQMPLVFNETAPMVDWLIGTERRAKVDWKVLPRTEDDVDGADAKTKVMKFVSDLNKVPFARSRAFADAIKSGLGWVDDGARDDPSKDILYSKYEDWRNVLHDSSGYDMDLEDARYVFRWRWVDDDIAEMMFPGRKTQIRSAVIDAGVSAEAETDADWYLGEQISVSGSLYAAGGGVYGEASRRRIKLIECQFRMPCMCRVVADGPLKGSHVTEHDHALIEALNNNQANIIDKVMMRMHIAVFTETSMLAFAPSAYRHNRFSLTPIWCYRNGRTRLPYGAIRRIRDIQNDLNKRASKALFMLSTNQIIAEKGAVADKQVARDEADQPDGYIEVTPGKKFDIRRDTDAATGQLQMMTLDAQSIQKSAGVNNENLGRQTNAVSGEAIRARQLQGSVATTEPFDNQRFAIQSQGEKMLSLVEQFYTEEKAVRLTGNRGQMEWMKVNVPEVQPDGSIRYINDISSSAADFVVAEQDYSGTLRQAMFDSMMDIAKGLPPEVGIRFVRMAYEYSDMPNKDAIADELRKITGERDENKKMTPEEAQAAEEQMQQQVEAMQMQRESAALALQEQAAKVEKLTAEAEKIRSEAGQQGVPPEFEQALTRVQEQATAKLEAMAEQLRKVQNEAANKTMAIKSDADTKLEITRIQTASAERIAEEQNKAAKQLDALTTRMEQIAAAAADAEKAANQAAAEAAKATKAAEAGGKVAEDATKAAKEAGQGAEKAVKAVEQATKDAAATKATEKQAPAAAAPNITVPITIEAGAFQVDAKPQPGSKTITLMADGKAVTGTIKQDAEKPKAPGGKKK